MTFNETLLNYVSLWILTKIGKKFGKQPNLRVWGVCGSPRTRYAPLFSMGRSLTVNNVVRVVGQKSRTTNGRCCVQWLLLKCVKHLIQHTTNLTWHFWGLPFVFDVLSYPALILPWYVKQPILNFNHCVGYRYYCTGTSPLHTCTSTLERGPACVTLQKHHY